MTNPFDPLQRQADYWQRQQVAIAQIKRCLPSATDEMILTFQRSQQVSLTTIRIWAEQGALKLAQNETSTVHEIIKTEPPAMSPAIAGELLREALEINRAPAWRLPTLRFPKGKYNGRPITGVEFTFKINLVTWRWLPTTNLREAHGGKPCFRWLCFWLWVELVYDWSSRP
jgi:hypothetical protein